jgi:peptidoglycan L-alanyl-D-glutamate endopeptidase CwlK
MRRAILRSPLDLTLLCGHRNQADQDAAVAAGASRLPWPRSAHNSTPSLAADVAPLVHGVISWDWEHYHQIAPAIRGCWEEMTEEGLTAGWTLTWGGDWRTLPDGPHWEIRAT